MITLDTSGMLALLDRRERHHGAAKTALLADRGPYIIPAGTLCEVGYFVRKRGRSDALDGFLADIESGAFALDCGEDDFPRVRELLRRYADLELGFTDAAVIACAERNAGKVLTFDRRDFSVVAGEGRITILPA
ncbi:MAG: PIN domain-containing protein [Actinomycetota bacterium]